MSGNKDPFFSSSIKRIEIPHEFFDQVHLWIQGSIEQFLALHIPMENIRIYIPKYFSKLYMVYMNDMLTDFEGMDIKTINGVDVLPGYVNAVIVSHLQALEYNHEPLFLEIP